MKSPIQTVKICAVGALLSLSSSVAPAQSWVVSPGTALPNDATATQYFPYRSSTNANISYGSHNSLEIGDLYLPNPMPTNRVPAVVVIHGGGGTSGSRLSTRETQQCQLLAAHGYVAFNIDYTVGKVWPNNIRDWRLAVRWLRANAATYNIDTNHIGQIGGSFGGYAAGIMSGLTNGQQTLIPDSNASYNNISLDSYSSDVLNGYSGDVQATMDLYGPMLFTGTAPFGDATGQYSSPTAATYYNASAVHYVHPTSAPMFIAQGTADGTVDITNSYVMTNALAQSGVPYQFARIPGGQHTFCIFDSTKGGTWPSGGTAGLIDLRKDMVLFFDKWLLVSGQAPGITTQPQPASGCVGSLVTFSVTANGSTPLLYRWLFNGANIPAATNASYSFTIADATNAGNYSVIVSNAFGTITSSNAALTVNVATPPAISAQPTNTTVLAGNTAAFSVVATGTALQYQWSGPSGTIAGATNATLMINNAQNSDVGNYSVTVFNTCNGVGSSVATLTVNGPPSITAPPGPQVACTGTAASFNVSAIGTAPLSYQWYDPSSNPISGAINSSVTLTNLVAGNSGNYFVIVTNVYGAVTSSVALLTVSGNSTISIATPPTNTEVLIGGTASFTVVPAGGGGYTYLWHAGDNEPIPHATSVTNATLTITNAQPSDIAPYACLVRNDCSQISTTPANLLVDYAPVITQQPTNTTVYSGASATLTVIADGSLPLRYQWRKGGTNENGQTNSVFSPGIVTTNNSGNYDVVITNSFGSATSSVAVITVLPSAAGNVLIAELYMHGGKTGATYNRDYVVLKNVTPNPVGMNGWSIQHFKTNATWFLEALPNATIPPGGYYLIQCYNDGGTAVGGALPTPDFTTAQSSLWNLSAGTGEAVALVNGTNVLTACLDATIVDKVGFNAGSVCYFGSGVAPTSTTTQSVQRNNTGCQNTADNAADFALGTPNPRNSASAAAPCVCVGAGILSNPTNLIVSVGDTASFSVTTSGSSPFNYQWRKAGVNIGGATNNPYSFTTSSTNDGGAYDVVVTNACGAITSAVATLTVTPIVPTSPSITAQPQSQTVNVGANATFSVTATGTAPLSYQWSKGASLIVGETNSSYMITGVTTNHVGVYSVIVSNAYPPVATSSNATLTVTVGAASSTTNFTSSGTWTCPADVTSVQVECWGGGGGGGGSTSIARCGGGGGGGAYVQNATVTVVPGTTYTVTVGNGGTAGGITVATSPGGAGSTSSFTGTNITTVAAVGGLGGGGGTSTTPNGTNGPGTSVGNAGFSGVFSYAGGNGAAGVAATRTGGGGGAAGSNGTGGTASAVAVTGGTAAGPVGGNGANGTSTATTTGAIGTPPGGAGSGGYNAVGGVGGKGQVTLTYSPGLVSTPPAATTQPATSVTAGSSSVNGSVSSGSANASVYFQYGATTNYGSVTTTNTILAGMNSVSASNTITGLVAGTLYHFRVVASSTAGATNGADATFTTLAVSPVNLQSIFLGTNSSFGFNFTNAPGASFTVVCTTNVSLPLTNWIAIGPMTEAPSGSYSFAVSTTNSGMRFYKVRTP